MVSDAPRIHLRNSTVDEQYQQLPVSRVRWYYSTAPYQKASETSPDVPKSGAFRRFCPADSQKLER